MSSPSPCVCSHGACLLNMIMSEYTAHAAAALIPMVRYRLMFFFVHEYTGAIVLSMLMMTLCCVRS